MTTSPGWTFATLEQHFSKQLADLRELIEQRHRNSEKAADLALKALDHRLEGMNEFRQTLSDQRLADERERSKAQENFVRKEIYDLEHRNLETLIAKTVDRINEIDKKLFALSELKVDKREGLSSKYMYSAILFASLSFIGTIIGILWSFARSAPPPHG
jgi:hypothetical protein